MTTPSTELSAQPEAFETEGDYGKVADLFKALAHPLRLKIVCGLLRSSATQTSIARGLHVPQSSVAQQLAVLRRTGIVVGKRSANEVILALADARIVAILRAACPHDGPGSSG